MEGLLFLAGRALASCRRDFLVKSLYLPFWNGQSTENRRTIDGETAKGQLSEQIMAIVLRPIGGREHRVPTRNTFVCGIIQHSMVVP